jgi:Cys-rich repeat protein
MMKHSVALLVSAMTSMLAGCSLYFGDSENDGSWNYCGEDGYYECEGNDCFWRGATCPAGAGSGGTTNPGGFECTDSNDCAAGCYCGENGTCEEAGFCTQDSDCGEGYVCNEDRSSCEPGTGNPGPTPCLWDSECPTGQYCSPDTLTCTATCTCTDDETAVANGFGWCDETRSTCLPGQDPAGTCGGEADGTSCTTFAPVCPSGQVPVMFAGCYTGGCMEYAACDVNPICEHINDAPNCDSRADCREVQNGVNCRDANGNNCQPGVGTCTCDSYVFASCASRAI